MSFRQACGRVAAVCFALLLSGLPSSADGADGADAPTHLAAVKGESVVLAGTKPASLLASRVDAVSVVVRSTHLADLPKTVVYERGKDFVIDEANGAIARTADSRIPDFATNVLYGRKDFDHSKFPGYGNLPFTVYVDYTGAGTQINTMPLAVADLLAKSKAKLVAGGPFKVIGYGDSITAGGEASSVDLQYGPRWVAESLRKRFPKAEITYENGATGGDATPQGLARLEEKVLTRKPDLVLVAFGMNDHNVGSTPLPAFEQNLKAIVTRIRERTGADVIFLSTFPPHPDWHYGSHQMEKYADATKRAAAELQAPYADVYGVWQQVLKRKDPASLLGNNINHPNDYGHWLYVVALDALKF
jgi:acyl-CoA thioesterase I